MSRFVRPETRTLTISDGDTLTVKKVLNAGEVRASYRRMLQAGGGGRAAKEAIAVHEVIAYLLDWSLTDDAGQRVEIRGLSADDLLHVLDSLDADAFDEIHAAIQRHEVEMAAERAEAKKRRGGESASAATSPSRSAAAGPSTPSETLTLMTTPS